MADETSDTTTAAENAAAQALKAVAHEGMTEEEARADDRAVQQHKQRRETEKALKKAQSEELHVAADLMPASSLLFGVPPEVVAGAIHFAGLEMTDEITTGDLATHIKSFMDQPA
jgi:primosomal protein N'